MHRPYKNWVDTFDLVRCTLGASWHVQAIGKFDDNFTRQHCVRGTCRNAVDERGQSMSSFPSLVDITRLSSRAQVYYHGPLLANVSRDRLFAHRAPRDALDGTVLRRFNLPKVPGQGFRLPYRLRTLIVGSAQ